MKTMRRVLAFVGIVGLWASLIPVLILTIAARAVKLNAPTVTTQLRSFEDALYTASVVAFGDLQ